MTKVFKMADLPVGFALKIFKVLNFFAVSVKKDGYGNYAIFSSLPPNILTYPKGWYYAKGCFRNKHNSTSGAYSEVIMLAPNGRSWSEFV
jgi:hypothetical protein